MRDMTLSELEQLGDDATAGEATFQMDEDAFRLFYERTARPVWAYLSRMSGHPRLADDLLQETYYRFLRAKVSHESEAHRRNYLFRIATNLVRDLHGSGRGGAGAARRSRRAMPRGAAAGGRHGLVAGDDPRPCRSGAHGNAADFRPAGSRRRLLRRRRGGAGHHRMAVDALG